MKKQLIALGTLLVLAIGALPGAAASYGYNSSYSSYPSSTPCCPAAPLASPCCPAPCAMPCPCPAAPIVNPCCPPACAEPCCPAPCAMPCPCPAAPIQPTCNDCCD